jgi:hypothetical protein
LPRTRDDNNNAIHAKSPSPLTPWNSVNGPVITSLTSCTNSSLNTSIPVQGNSTKEQFKLWLATKIWPWSLDQRDNVVRRSCINSRRRAKLYCSCSNHANTAKTSSEKNEYFLKDVFACFLQGVNIFNIKSTCKDYTKSSKYKQQDHLHCFSASMFPVISSSSRQASVAPNCWSCLGLLSGTNSSPTIPGPTTEFYLSSHANNPLPC